MVLALAQDTYLGRCFVHASCMRTPASHLINIYVELADMTFRSSFLTVCLFGNNVPSPAGPLPVPDGCFLRGGGTHHCLHQQWSRARDNRTITACRVRQRMINSEKTQKQKKQEPGTSEGESCATTHCRHLDTLRIHL